jgi:hypothetical protein
LKQFRADRMASLPRSIVAIRQVPTLTRRSSTLSLADGIGRRLLRRHGLGTLASQYPQRVMPKLCRQFLRVSI